MNITFKRSGGGWWGEQWFRKDQSSGWSPAAHAVVDPGYFDHSSYEWRITHVNEPNTVFARGLAPTLSACTAAIAEWLTKEGYAEVVL